MAGHSKWKNIQARKGAQDKKKAKIFTRCIREITIAAKLGGGDVNTNPRLRTAIENARNENMANDTVDRAVKRGAGGLDGDNMEDITYEGYAPGGVAVMVECLTDNRNRTVSEVRHAFSKRGGNLGTEGSVSYLFSKLGQLYFAPGSDEDMEVALEAGAQDVITQDDGSIEVLCAPDDYENLRSVMTKNNLKPEHSELGLLASTYISVEGEEAEKVAKLLEMLEDLDDVQNVYSNADIPDEYLQ